MDGGIAEFVIVRERYAVDAYDAVGINGHRKRAKLREPGSAHGYKPTVSVEQQHADAAFEPERVCTKSLDLHIDADQEVLEGLVTTTSDTGDGGGYGSERRIK